VPCLLFELWVVPYDFPVEALHGHSQAGVRHGRDVQPVEVNTVVLPGVQDVQDVQDELAPVRRSSIVRDGTGPQVPRLVVYMLAHARSTDLFRAFGQFGPKRAALNGTHSCFFLVVGWRAVTSDSARARGVVICRGLDLRVTC
jgi:hypothetical protein